MDVREFMIKFDEMCRANDDCHKCPLMQQLIGVRGGYLAGLDRRYMSCASIAMKYGTMSERVIENWAAEHKGEKHER